MKNQKKKKKKKQTLDLWFCEEAPGLRLGIPNSQNLGDFIFITTVLTFS